MAQDWQENLEQRRTMILRLGAYVRLDSLATIPARLRTRTSQLQGRLSALLVAPADGACWARLDRATTMQIWPPGVRQVEERVIPLTGRQDATPPVTAIALRPAMRVACEDGEFGRVEGIALDGTTGLLTALVVVVRSSFALTSNSDPMRAFVPRTGQTMLIAVDWMAKIEPAANPLQRPLLHLAATSHQVAHGIALRDDTLLMQEIYTILGENPALAQIMHTLTVNVRDGAVTITSADLSPRLRASLEQDVWHVPGVLDIRTRLRA